MFAFVSAPADDHELPLPTHGSLSNNQLCGIYMNYITDELEGTYTAEGITKLFDALKGSSVTSLKCAAAPKASAFMSAPADTPAVSPPLPHPSLAVS